MTPVRLRRKEAAKRRAHNAARLLALLERFRSLDIDPVLVIVERAAREILAAFLDWTDLRRTRRVVGA